MLLTAEKLSRVTVRVRLLSLKFELGECSDLGHRGLCRVGLMRRVKSGLLLRAGLLRRVKSGLLLRAGLMRRVKSGLLLRAGLLRRVKSGYSYEPGY